MENDKEEVVVKGQHFKISKTENNFYSISTGPNKIEGVFTNKVKALEGIEKYLTNKKTKPKDK